MTILDSATNTGSDATTREKAAQEKSGKIGPG